jgi:hypothetical protein
VPLRSTAARIQSLTVSLHSCEHVNPLVRPFQREEGGYHRLMSRRADYRAALRAQQPTDWPLYLHAHSGLPGPRANLELVQAVADVGGRPTFDALIATDEEYLVLCGAVGLGRVMSEQKQRDVEQQLRTLANDRRWRVREGVAMALQRVGDADIDRLLALAESWAGDTRALVQRAAVAGVCEPRLLRTPGPAAAAVDLCVTVTESMAGRPRDGRRGDDVRSLRQALGYCWSVAVAACPAAGLPRFKVLASSDDVDVRWIVKENEKKVRLAKLL